jgi:cell wall-associated NlpC family hydrolase
MPSTAAVFLVLLLMSCSSSVPRFRSPGAPSGIVVQEDDEFHFASRIKEDETREDDRKVDLQKMKKELSRTRMASSRYTNRVPKGLSRDEVLLDVVSYLGVPYEFGGSTKKGIDCSGLTSRVYTDAIGKSLPHSTGAQYSTGAEVPQNELEFGDLVFFNTTGRGPSHVGIYIEDDLFVHASVSYGVTISSLESSYYKNRFVGARRIVD